MKARDIMVSPVITVPENSSIRDVAKTLLAKHISAVPVVNSTGKIVGIVSEADLMHRTEAGTERPTSWWLSLISGDQTLASEYVASHARCVKDVMTTDVHTATPDTPVVEIADMFEEKHVKRVPIVNDAGDLVGIVSRANIVQAVASARPALATTLPDTKIRERLIAELKKQPWSHVHKLNVTVANGVVDLWGFAQSESGTSGDQSRSRIRSRCNRRQRSSDARASIHLLMRRENSLHEGVLRAIRSFHARTRGTALTCRIEGTRIYPHRFASICPSTPRTSTARHSTTRLPRTGERHGRRRLLTARRGSQSAGLM